MSIYVHSAGLLPPIEGEKYVREQMRGAHRYRNALIEISRGERAAKRDVVSTVPDVKTATVAAETTRAALAIAYEAIRNEHVTRREKSHDAMLQAALDLAKANHMASLDKLSEVRRVAYDLPGVRAEFARIDELANGTYPKSALLWASGKCDKLEPLAEEDECSIGDSRPCDCGNEECFSVVEPGRLATKNGKKRRKKARRVGGIRKSLAAQCGVWWGTKALVATAMDASLKRVLGPDNSIPLPLWDGLEPADPSFVPWRDARYKPTIGAYNNGGSKSNILDDVLAIEPARVITDRPPRGLDAWPENWSEAHPMPILRLRMGEDVVRFPMKLHRPLPADARITAVKVLIHREGPQVTPRPSEDGARPRRLPGEDWEVQFTVETEAVRTRSDRGHEGEPDVCGRGAVALHVGWRAMSDGTMRVGTWRNEREECGTISLSREMLAQLSRPNEIRSARDELFNQAKLALAWFIAVTHPDRGSVVPSWMPSAAAVLDWGSPSKLAGLCFEWRKKRFSGDEEIYRLLDDWTDLPKGQKFVHGEWRGHDESWRRRDKHLWIMEAAMRNKSIASRNDFFRVTAAQFARAYGTAVIADFDISDVAERPALEEEDDAQSKKSRSQRHMAACSELRAAFINAFKSRCGEVVKVEPKDITHTCPKCGTLTQYDAAKNLNWKCGNEACGASWDQDSSATLIELARAREEVRAKKKAGIARDGEKPAKRESKWAKIARKKAERDAARASKNGTARKDDPDDSK